MSRSDSKKRSKHSKNQGNQKVLVGSSIVHLSGFSICDGRTKELDLTSLSSKQIRKKIGWL
ncbi:MAG: hypothetical protein K9L95_00095 [Candidatus Omnitrophica bacterium]|nr:hypothetical protein [Candidatus Omnitrophota bacterium]MCF7877500.1 hypothetical protein [Candidatus Omnitrophota bacterium]MCF7877861.1 hypothetical protein [Candidatus Omnitrophota bacterium]MCF7892553.1 hypothetical protein [Candidatus Omnitrophota bacterium]